MIEIAWLDNNISKTYCSFAVMLMVCIKDMKLKLQGWIHHHPDLKVA